MWWSQGVADAIKTCQDRKSVLVVLVEPASTVIEKKTQVPETSQQLLSRVATSCMHRITYSNAAVSSAIADSRAVCLKFPSDEANADFKAFIVYFKLSGTPPNLYMISPLTGETLVHMAGFVSPRAFLDALVATTKTVAGREIAVPEIKEPSGSRSKASNLQLQALLNAEIDEDDRRGQDVVQTKREVPRAVEPLKSEPIVTSASASASNSLSASSVATSMKLPGPHVNESSEESRLLARLPGGAQVRKSFPKTTQFAVVRSWLSEEVKSPANTLIICTAFPRRVFDLGENPKMLSELNLFPSETLIVALGGNAQDSTPKPQSSNPVPLSGLKSFATGALGVLGGFFRSFVADNPNASPEGQQQHAIATAPGVRQRPQMGSTTRMGRTEMEDDENLLSNGNSTQYGWNPRDEEDQDQN